MKALCLALVALELITGAFGTSGSSSQVEKRQWYGFGCGQSLPTIGNYCYQPVQDGTVVCRATGSSTYTHRGYPGDYRAYLAVDGFLSPGNSGFYHSHYEAYPWLKIDIMKPDLSDFEPKEIKRVQVFQRCDANELYHPTSFDVRVNDGDPGTVYANPRLVGGKVCGTRTFMYFSGGTQFMVPCAAPIPDAKEVFIQKTTLHSHGQGWPGYGGGQWNSYTGNSPAQNSNVPACFLMINEVVLY